MTKPAATTRKPTLKASELKNPWPEWREKMRRNWQMPVRTPPPFSFAELFKK